MNKPKAVSYSRFSASIQAKGSSIERQRELFERWLIEHPEYERSDLNGTDRGVSAFKGKHKTKELGDVLKAIEGGQIRKGDCLVIEALDRLSRQEFDPTYQTVRSIVNAGVVIWSIEDNHRYDYSSLNGTEIHGFAAKVNAANEYSKRLSERISAAYKAKKNKASEGLAINAPNRPFWIDKQGKRIEGQQALPLRVIELYKQGEGQLSILKTVHKEFSSLELAGEAKKPPLTTKSIKRLLTNEALIGHWKGLKSFDAIISIAEFFELQTLVKQRTIPNKSAETYLLSGLLRCRECGSAYNFRTQAARATKAAPIDSEAYKAKGLIVYANCSSFLKSNRCSNSFTVPYEVAELVYDRTYSEYLLGLAQGVAVDALSNKVTQELQAEYDLLNKTTTALKNIYEFTTKTPDFEKYKESYKRLEVVQAKLNKQKQVAAELEELKSVPEYFTDEDFLNGTKDQQEFHAATQKAIYELEANVVNLRNALKASGYKIEAGRPNADADAGHGVLTIDGNEYRIQRRSQLELCYVIQAREIDSDGELVEQVLKARRKPFKVPAPNQPSVNK